MPEPKKPKAGMLESPDQDEDEKRQVKKWMADITKAEKWRDGIAEKSGWKRFLKEYQGDWGFLQASVSIPLVAINYVFSFIKTEIARLYFRDPWITVNPKRVEDITASQIAEQIVNYTWGELDLKREMKSCLLEALIVGHSWIKTGYVAEFGTVESRPNDAKRGPGRPPKTEAIVDTNEYLKSESVFAYNVPWDHVVFDPTAQWPPIKTARWIAIKSVKSMRAVEESGIYEHVDKLKAAHFPSKMGDNFTSEKTENDGESGGAQGVSLWEIYDLDHRKVLTISPGSDYYLRQIEYPDYLGDSFPLDMLYFNPIPGKAYPMSDIAPHEAQIVEMMKMNAIMLNHLKRFNRQIFMKPDIMTNENKSNFKQGVDGAVIEVQSSGPIEADFFIPPYPPIQQDIYGVWNINMDLWRNVSGQSDLERGGNARTQTRTLGELRTSMQGGRARADEKIDCLEEFISGVARKMLKVIQTKYDLPKIARIVGTQTIQKEILAKRPSAQDPATAEKSFTADFGFSWNKKDIAGEMDVDVLAGSTVPLNKENQLEILEKIAPLLPTFGVVPGSQAGREFAREIFRLIDIKSLERVADIAETEAKTHPQQNPKMMELQAKVQAKQQESQIKQQGMKAKTQADITKAQIDIQKAKLHAEVEEKKLHLEQQKHQMQTQHQIMQNLLAGVRGNGNGGGHDQA